MKHHTDDTISYKYKQNNYDSLGEFEGKKPQLNWASTLAYHVTPLNPIEYKMCHTDLEIVYFRNKYYFWL